MSTFWRGGAERWRVGGGRQCELGGLLFAVLVLAPFRGHLVFLSAYHSFPLSLETSFRFSFEELPSLYSQPMASKQDGTPLPIPDPGVDPSPRPHNTSEHGN